MLNVLIADDERIARDIVTLLLSKVPDQISIQQAKDGKQTLEKVRQCRPDILFLDIQMPGHSGIELASMIDPKIVVIFVTAFNEFAIEAFEHKAIDYLLKPFEDKRFYKAWDKAKEKVYAQFESDYAELNQLMKGLNVELKQRYKSRLIVKEPGKIYLIDIQKIKFITGAGNYAELHLFEGKVILHRETLTVLETQLDPDIFIRIHRSSIVRRDCIKELRPNDKGDYAVLLNSGETLNLSRRNKSKLRELLN